MGAGAAAGCTNVIVIVSDDQGPWAMNCAGNKEILTPSLDALASTGTRFSNFFCVSPVCSPARASLYSGLTPSQHGVHDHIRQGNSGPAAIEYLEGLTLLSDLLSSNGYVCGLSGKWHLGASDQPQHGFEHWYAHPGGMGSYLGTAMFRGAVQEQCDGYVTDAIADDAISFMRDATEGKRHFFSLVGFTAPHSPWVGQHPEDLMALYRDCDFLSCPQEPWHPWGPTSFHVDMMNAVKNPRESLKGYFAAVTGMDRAIGRILSYIDAAGLREDTVVLFVADNGFNCGHHGIWGKGNATFPQNMYEESVRVPAILRCPNQAAGSVFDGLVSAYDVYPTIAELCGIPIEDGWDRPGRSLKPLLDGQTAEGWSREIVTVYSEYGPTRMARSAEWKDARRYPDGPDELYWLAEDPGERRNLIDDAVSVRVLPDLRLALEDWFGRYARGGFEGILAPVTGAGQRDRMGPAGKGREAFYPPAGWAYQRVDMRQLRERDWEGGY